MVSTQLPPTCKAVVIKEPYVVEIESVPTPRIKGPNDVVLKVSAAGLCGESGHPQR